MKRSKVAILKAKGFDESKYDGNGHWRVRCSQCEALVINGIPTHERGCPNEVRETEEE